MSETLLQKVCALARVSTDDMKKLIVALIIAAIAGGGWGIAYFIFG